MGNHEALYIKLITWWIEEIVIKHSNSNKNVYMLSILL